MRTDNNEAFAARLRGLMEDEGLTQTQLALMVRVAQSRVSDWRSGKAIPQPRVADALATALSVNPQWLMTGKGLKTLPRPLTTEELAQHSLSEPPPEFINWRQRALDAEAKLEELQNDIAAFLKKK